jgi:hypothetical protein
LGEQLREGDGLIVGVGQAEVGSALADLRCAMGGGHPARVDHESGDEEEDDHDSERGGNGGDDLAPTSGAGGEGATKSDERERGGDGEEDQVDPRDIASCGKADEEGRVAHQRDDSEEESGPKRPMDGTERHGEEL